MLEGGVFLGLQGPGIKEMVTKRPSFGLRCTRYSVSLRFRDYQNRHIPYTADYLILLLLIDPFILLQKPFTCYFDMELRDALIALSPSSWLFLSCSCNMKCVLIFGILG